MSTGTIERYRDELYNILSNLEDLEDSEYSDPTLYNHILRANRLYSDAEYLLDSGEEDLSGSHLRTVVEPFIQFIEEMIDEYGRDIIVYEPISFSRRNSVASTESSHSPSRRSHSPAPSLLSLPSRSHSPAPSLMSLPPTPRSHSPAPRSSRQSRRTRRRGGKRRVRKSRRLRRK